MYKSPLIISFALACAVLPLRVVSAEAVDNLGLDIPPANFQQVSNDQKTLKVGAELHKQVASAPTRSGMKNQFDASMGRATFVWGGLSQVKPTMHRVVAKERPAHAADSYLNQLTGFSSQAKSGSGSVVFSSLHNLNRGAVVAKYRQQVQGIEVFNKEYNVMMDQENNLVAAAGYLANKPSAPEVLSLMSHFDSAEPAVYKAIDDLSKGMANVVLNPSRQQAGYTLYDVDNLNDELQVVGEPRTKKVFYELNGKLISAYYVEVGLAAKGDTGSMEFSYVIGASGNKIYFRNNLTADDHQFTYRVYADPNGEPWQGPFGDVLPDLTAGNDVGEELTAPLVTLSNHASISTADPWLDETAEMTSGNNVFAYADVIAPDGYTSGDYAAQTSSYKTFDYPFDSSLRASSLVNGRAAVVNLFYINNYLHDWWYDHGFDEASGNAQLSNYGRGGVEGDPLLVQAQDYSGINNANMTTYADGRSPRMQQYLFNDWQAENGVDSGLTITSHPALGLLASTKLSNFGPSQYGRFSGRLVRAIDGKDANGGTFFDGCQTALNADELVGAIAVIDRGKCDFRKKVKLAQDAGATAVIIVDNVQGGIVPVMNGSAPLITIPNVSISYEEGHAIYALLASGETVTAELFSTYPLKDSSFDNGVVAHEWGHYIQNRLIGNGSGLSNFQGSAMGEGWGDFHGLMLLVKEGQRNIEGSEAFETPYSDTSYVLDPYYGFRRVRYTPDMAINPLSFRHITSGAGADVGLPPTNGLSPHAAGEVWASMLWDIYVKLLNTYTFNEAQSRMADYLVAGYKLTPISPTFTEARDALLAAMFANEPADYRMALEAFARRGIGLGAVSPERYSTDNQGVIESTATRLATFDGLSIDLNSDYDGSDKGYCSNDSIFDAGETATVVVTIANKGSEILTGLTAQLLIVSDHDVSIENDGVIRFDEVDLYADVTSAPLTITLNEAGVADTLLFEVVFTEQSENEAIQTPSALSFDVRVNYDFVPRPLLDDVAFDDMETIATSRDWPLVVLSGTDAALTTRIPSEPARVEFLQRLNPDIDLGEQTMFLLNNPFPADVAVETHLIEVAYNTNFSISFWHFYWLEEGYDGGVVEISVNDGDWVEVTEAGGVFDLGYSGDLLAAEGYSGSARAAYTGTNGDLETFAGNIETINFGDRFNGQSVRLRFRIFSDEAVADFGWFIDNVTFTNVYAPVFSLPVAGDTFACDNSAPKITLSDSFLTVNEGAVHSVAVTATDRNPEDVIAYQWHQAKGPGVSMDGADTAELTFTAPAISRDAELVFDVVVDDGVDRVSSSVTVLVKNVEPPTNSSASGGGGGAIGWFHFSLLFLVALLKRKVLWSC